MRPTFSMSGVVDLSALKQPTGQNPPHPAAAAPGAAAGGGPAGAAQAAVIDVDETDFQSAVIERSLTAPIVVQFTASWSEQGQQLAGTLEKLAREFAGAFVFARVDAEANPRLAQALRVPGLPAVVAIVGGELVGQFAGAQPEAQLRQWLTELLAMAQREFGIAAGQGAAAAPAEPPMDPALAAAYQALDDDDLDGAAQALRNVLAKNPNDPEAKPALAQVELMRRTRGVDPAEAAAKAAADPADLNARLTAADAALASGDPETALSTVLDAVRDFSGDEREQARKLLLDYFELLGPQEPLVTKARARLTSLLF